MSRPRSLPARFHKWWVRTAGDLTLNSTPWAAVPTVATLTLAAEVGDTLEVLVAGTYGTEAVDAFLDVHTGSNYFATAGGASGEGIPLLGGVSGAATKINGTWHYDVQAGDLASGYVTLALRYRTASASNRTLRANTNQPLLFRAWNRGLPDPN